jgi:O-antigen ligase
MPTVSRYTTALASAAVFLFLATNLSWPNGYSIGSALVLLVALYILATRHPPLNAQLRPFVACCLLMVLAGFWVVLYHHDHARELDLPLRYLAAVLLVWAGSAAAPRLGAWWAGSALGACSGALVAYRDIHSLGLERSTGYTGGIQFGNIGLMLGVFSAAGLVWAARSLPKGAAKATCLLVLGLASVAGLYISITSGSRGGWVAVPVAVVLFAVALVPARYAVRAVLGLAVACALAAAIAWQVPMVQERYTQVVSDLNDLSHGEYDTSVGLRIGVWQAAIAMVAEHPLAGWGDAGYHAELLNGAREGRYAPAIEVLANTHNTYLEAWVKYGALGIVAVVGMFISSFLLFARNLRHTNPAIQAVALCGTCLAAMYALFCLTHVMLGRNNTLLFYLVGVASLWNMLAALKNTQGQPGVPANTVGERP